MYRGRVEDLISIQDFRRLDIRVGVVVNVEKIPRTDRLYKVQVGLGELGKKQTISSLTEYYAEEELLGKRVVFLANLESARFSGEVSEGMLLAAEKAEKLALLTVDREIENGAKVT
jgi:methionine--tRNA ligase beta chain